MDNTGQREHTPVQKYREAKISFEPYEKMLADERQGTRTDLSDGSPGGAEVRDLVAEKADIGSGRTYSRLHKVMLAGMASMGRA